MSAQSVLRRILEHTAHAVAVFALFVAFRPSASFGEPATSNDFNSHLPGAEDVVAGVTEIDVDQSAEPPPANE